MGEAKRRGGQTERVAAAKQREAQSIADTKRRLDIPDAAEFVGYVVHLEASDEFLVDIEASAAETRRIWSRAPGDARLFPRLEACEAARNDCRGAVSAALFETADQFFTAIVANTSD